MPKEVKYSVTVSAFERLAVKSNGMPVNTRSMQRLSSTPQGSSSQARPGASRGTPQYAMTPAGTSNANVESSDEDTDEDDDEEEEEGDAGDESNDSSDAESDDSDDEDDPASEVREMFAIAEPSGLAPVELERNQVGNNEAS
jgi:hypothetical protein